MADELKDETTPDNPGMPPSKLTSLGWLQEGFTRLEVKIDEAQKDINQTKIDIARIEERTKPIPDTISSINKKIDSLQRTVWVAVGIFVVIAFLARFFLPDINITMPEH